MPKLRISPTANMRTIKELKSFSKKNKKRDVSAEKVFRKLLQDNSIHYQRQKVISKFIVDFYLPKRNLIIEIDEKYHDNQNQKEYDKTRQSLLESYGYRVIRFKDFDVYTNPEWCIHVIKGFAESEKLYRECKSKLAIINS